LRPASGRPATPRTRRMSHVIAIANQKGGVGKTTTAINLGASLAAAEKRVLIIDMDPQGNATSGLGVNARGTKATIYGVLLNRLPMGSAILRGIHLPLLDVVPTTINLVGAEAELVGQPQWQFRLREALDGTRDMYDYILVDCPPALGVLTLNTLVASDTVLVPLQAEYFALEGLSQFAETIEVVRRHLNPRLGVEGVLLTMFDGRLKLAQQVSEEARQYFGGRVFRTAIPRNVRLAEAPSFGQPTLLYDVTSSGAHAYLSLAQEVILRSPMMEVDGHQVEDEQSVLTS
jgi:chromosome partitioning protein